ncbi:MAG TPA: ATP synthase F1 subunit epsilon [Candidatus Kapabacteria bacterium]|jgi:F-type H+-transporting ATPase subunit epsilon|nr:ATP synthase F1 subunit epsilon [Candidatus Kapabacteria bacterium]HOM04303.1 ATP synthase F1 subunit epsilon [Candidatus Kapabacteria bacterium]HPP38889.1 ATP synthase F1 subunit epsilon [Candidatus Kapabacteria bacterium]HPU23809.1 ATP synthase F1 subunit epsilon [Candidatus Kapabacteria bacterium]
MLYIELVTPEKKIFSGKVQSVWFPGSLSPFQVLPNHAPIVSSLDAGVLKFLDEQNNIVKYAITGGFVDLQNNKASIMLEKAISADGLKLETVKLQLEKAKENLKTAKQTEDKTKAQKELDFAKACLNILQDEN